jgi:copper homeostasis protein
MTPPPQLTANVARTIAIPFFVLVRPRPGDFCYSDEELSSMKQDVRVAIEAGASGIVSGVLTRDGGVATQPMQELVESVEGLPLTFHRAFDVVDNQSEALETLIGLRVARVLTSGRGSTALEGAAEIAALVRQAASRIEILAGGGIRDHNVAAVIEQTNVREVHSRLVDESSMRRLVVNAREARAFP